MKHYLRYSIAFTLFVIIAAVASCSRNQNKSTDGESVVPESVSPLDSEKTAAPDSAAMAEASLDDSPSGRPVVLEFSATWCGPCRKQKPIYEEAIKKYGDRIDMRSIDVDENPELANRYHIQTIPAFIFIDGKGKVVGKADFLEADQLDAALQNLLK